MLLEAKENRYWLMLIGICIWIWDFEFVSGFGI